MTNKCKICGGQVTVDAQNGIAICDYCGTKQALPLFTQNSERMLYESGNNYLSHSEYDKAENVFNQLLTIKPDAAELYWDLVLCKYGVTYVKDPKTGKYIPTCNRTHYTPIFSDENYKKAIELSSGEKKALFEEDAKTINNIQKGILAVSKKEKPFDIFISYKETDASGNRTKDSIEAQKLYTKLTEAGYKVFFSRITLEDKIGTEYEPYIYAALYSSKVMLTVCSSKENIEAVWVKNEWSRFLGFRQSDNSKTLLPLYFGMPKEELPDEFALFSAYDMSAEGFTEELLRGIKKLIPMPILLAKRRKQLLKTVGISLAGLAVVAGIAAALIVPKKLEQKRLQEAEAALARHAAAYQDAVKLFESGDYTAASDAFVDLGDYEDAAQMATTCIREGEYQAAKTLFDNADYTAASDAFIALGDYKDSADMVTKCAIQPDYDTAMQLYTDGKYAQATWAFEALGEYEDAAAQKENAKLSWRESLATTSVEVGYNAHVNFCEITPNGTVFDGLTEIITVGEHGKVVSIANGFEYPLALYEDGTLSDGKVFEDANWQDVVQITAHFDLGKIALKSDGTVTVENLGADQYEEYMMYAVSCFEDTANWKNITGLYTYAENYEYSAFHTALAGVDVDGNVFLCYQMETYSPEENGYQVRTFQEYADQFTNVKSMELSIEKEWDADYNITYYINAVAQTNDGKVVTYQNGEISVQDAADADGV